MNMINSAPEFSNTAQVTLILNKILHIVIFHKLEHNKLRNTFNLIENQGHT